MTGLAGQIRNQEPSLRQSLPRTDPFSSQDRPKSCDLFNKTGGQGLEVCPKYLSAEVRQSVGFRAA